MLPFDPEAAVQSRRSAHPDLERLIDAVGAFELPAPPDITPFQSLMNAVLAQQISRHAAVAIRRRLYALFPDSGIPTHEDILSCSEEKLRGVGISRNKIAPVTDLGIRRGFKIAFELEEMPKPRELADYGLRWKPYRSVASWYLWRANDL